MKCSPMLCAAIAAISFGLGIGSRMAGAQPEETFRSLMEAAMARMHHDMAIPYTGDVDRDFATSMIAHHQGAIDMALIELRFGHDPRLLRLAQGIIVEQRQEIAVMRQVLADLPKLRDGEAPVAVPPPAGHKH